jgi:hypothetical protein
MHLYYYIPLGSSSSSFAAAAAANLFLPFLEDWSFLFGKEETLFTCAHRRVL